MLQLYVYNESVPLGKERLGSEGKHIWRDLKTVQGAVGRANKLGYVEFSIYKFTNIYDDSTYSLAYRQSFVK